MADMVVDVEKYVKAMDKLVENLAYLRRMAETRGCDMAYIDDKINESCDKWHKKFAEMSGVQLMFKGMMDIVKAGRGEDLLKAMMDEDEE